VVDRVLEQFHCPVRQLGAWYFAWGYGGQFTFVMPTYDLVVVNRGPNEGKGGPVLRQVGRLPWLVLEAGHFPDIGPDATVAAGEDQPLNCDVLKELITGKTLRHGVGTVTGPYRIKLDVDGDATVLRGLDRVQFDAGTWRVDGDRLCRDWHKTEPLHTCWSAIGKDDHISLFGGDGLMVIDAHLEAN
jgi:hypothetical protein